MSESEPHENDDYDANNDENVEEQTYETTNLNSGVSRRGVLQTIGVGAAATVGPGAGTAYADHGGTDPLADDGSDTSTDSDGSFLDEPETYAVAAALAGPTAAFGFAAAEEYELGEKVADALFGVFDDSGEQLQSDTYFHGKTVQQSVQDMLGLLANHRKDAKNRWVADAKYETAKALKAGDSESAAVSATTQAAYDAAAPMQKNLIKTLESLLLRLRQFTSTLEAADGVAPSDILGQRVVGLVPIHIELLNGEEVATWAAVVEDSSYGNTLLVHPYFDLEANSDANGNGLQSYVVESDSEIESAAVSAHPSSSITTSDMQFAAGKGYDAANMKQLDSNNGSYQFVPYEFVYDLAESSSIGSSSSTLEEWIVHDFHDYIITAASDAEQIVTDAYSTNVDPDKIATDLVTDPVVYTENVAGDWQETGSFGYAQALALSAGYESDLNAGMDVQVTDTSESTTITYEDTSLFLDGWSPEHSVTSTSVTDGDFILNFAAGGGSDTVTLSRGTSVDVSHASSSITSVTVEADYGGSTYTLSDGSATSVDITTADLEGFTSEAGYAWGDTVTISVTAQTSSASGSGSVDVTLAQYDAATGTTYTVPSGQSAYVVERGESGASLVSIESGDEFTIQSVTDADGNSVGGLTLQNSGRYTVDNADIIDTINRQRENEQEIDEKTGGGGGGSAGGGGMPVPGWLLGGGIVTTIVYYVLGDGDGFDI